MKIEVFKQMSIKGEYLYHLKQDGIYIDVFTDQLKAIEEADRLSEEHKRKRILDEQKELVYSTET